MREELGTAEADILVGWVGRLDRKKRAEDLSGLRRLWQRNACTRFVVVGGPDTFMPEYAQELQDSSASLGIKDQLRFLGGWPVVPRLLTGLDMFVWLSEGEGKPRVIAKAGAAGLAVVATRDNGTLEQIVDGQTGLFVPHRDLNSAADTIFRRARDPNLQKGLGEGRRAKVVTMFSADVIVSLWEALLAEVAARDS